MTVKYELNLLLSMIFKTAFKKTEFCLFFDKLPNLCYHSHTKAHWATAMVHMDGADYVE